MDPKYAFMLERMFRQVDDLTEQVACLREDVAGLKVKAGVWGFAAGAFTSLLAFFAQAARSSN